MIAEPKEVNPSTARTDLLSRREVALRFGVTPQTITRWANEGIIPHVRTLGGQRRYPAYEVERLMSKAWENGVPGAMPPYAQRESERLSRKGGGER